MIEQRTSHIEEHVSKESRLPEKTTAFVEYAFAHGIVEKIDEIKKLESPKKRQDWERNKWVLVRYVTDEKMTFDGLTNYHIDWAHGESIRHVYYQTLITIWEASPVEMQQKFPKEEVLKGKRKGHIEGVKHSQEARGNMSKAHTGKKLSKKHRANISSGLYERWRKRKEE